MASMKYICCVSGNREGLDHQGENQAVSVMTAPTEWKENGNIAKWINLLERFKTADSSYKWRIYLRLKREGFIVGTEDKLISPALYQKTINLANLVNFTDIGYNPDDAFNHALDKLVRFLKRLVRLVKEFRRMYKPDKSPAKMLHLLAKHNPKVFMIREEDSGTAGHSATIEIVNLLTATEFGVNRKEVKLAVSIKVMQYMLQLSKIVNIIPIETNEDELDQSECHTQPKLVSFGQISVGGNRMKEIGIDLSKTEFEAR